MRIHLCSVALFSSLGLSSLAVAQDDKDICNGADFAHVTQRAPASFDARAVWLNGSLLTWPGAAPDARYRLYHSARAAIVATPGAKVSGADGSLALAAFGGAVPAAAAARFKWVGKSPVLEVAASDRARLPALHTGQLVLVQESGDGAVLDATRIQHAGALDALYAGAAKVGDLGVRVTPKQTRFTLWAPTAQRVLLCTYADASAPARAPEAMQRDAVTGVWRLAKPGSLQGQYYKYVVDVVVDGHGLVRNLVTDPYSVSLNANSQRSYIADLNAAALKPAGWDGHRAPRTVKAPTDMAIYELHVRDFSLTDASVPAPLRGKYGAFALKDSHGMRHLKALARAGMTDIHLLPIYDLSTIPEKDCAVPQPAGGPDSERQQALLGKTRETDCFNWGYDPWHYNAPEGSYASDADDGAARIRETRQMVMALHQAGLRVGMDVVYNHTFVAGQHEKSVLDRIVPGYYHRLSAKGVLETSTCGGCGNTATENAMMGKLMIDSAILWARDYKIDSFRFDLMGHQPRAVMQDLQRKVDAAAGRHVQLIGEGWNFGEVADGARFVQASQLSLNGSGIGTFSDRARDALRGGGVADPGAHMVKLQGYLNGLVYDANEQAGARPAADLLRAADMIRVGLAGSVRPYPLTLHTGETRTLERLDYAGQPAGYASQPGEAVNYVENHDNHTLYDINAIKLPQSTTGAERARVQMLGAAINAFSQGVAYFHAGIDTLRSKSLDRNSFNSGDWFNRIDWTYQDNYFGTGMPPAEDNARDFAVFRPILANQAIKPAPADIAFARDGFRDLLSIRASSTLFRLRSTADIVQRLRFFNTGPAQVPTVLAARIDGTGYAGAGFAAVTYLVNVDKVARVVPAVEMKGRMLRLHPVHVAPGAADRRALEARFDAATGTFTVPARTAVVFVE